MEIDPPKFSFYPAIRPPVSVSLLTLSQHPCMYLPPRFAQSRAVWAEKLPPDLYEKFMNAGFRRSGKVIYQPICAGCRSCRPLRVPVQTFRPDKSQRRSVRRNQDITVSVASPLVTDEAFELYRKYTAQWHGSELGSDLEGDSVKSFARFLYDSPVETLEFKYRDSAGQLLAIGICDVSSDVLSSVYFFSIPRTALEAWVRSARCTNWASRRNMASDTTIWVSGSRDAARWNTRIAFVRLNYWAETDTGGGAIREPARGVSLFFRTPETSQEVRRRLPQSARAESPDQKQRTR